ncbi:MAG: methylornithine synthase PylB [archaeon]|nr:methylornithine synthase PylB [archaeon]
MDSYEILKKCQEGHIPVAAEMEALLADDDPEFVKELYATAAKVRDEHFGKKLFMYGFVYFSTYCKNNCAFCYYRRSNDIDRYRKTREEVLMLSASLRDAGVNMVDLTMGEDPELYRNDYEGLIDLVKGVRETVGDLGIMVSPGAVSREAMPRLRAAGADWFACYQETYNRELFAKLRLEQDYQFRIDQRKWAREAGMLTEDGMLVGTGEDAADHAEQIRIMGELGCQQVRAMTFVPQEGTPMQCIVPSDPQKELKAIAVMRLAYPDKLIPASLDVEGINGLKTRIDAGANVITSIVPPHEELAGVAQPELDINDGHRSVDYVKAMVKDMGRYVASNAEFREFMEKNRPRAVY